MKITFQYKQVGWFSPHSENQKLSKYYNENYSGPENGKTVNSQFSCNFRSVSKWKRKENKVLYIQKEYNRNAFDVISDHEDGRHHPRY